MIDFKMFLFIILISFSFSYTQNIVGKMYSKQEADNLYGPIINVVQVKTSFLSKYLISQSNYIMFRIYNNNIFILDSERRPIYPESAIIKPEDVFRCFSISMVIKTLSTGNELTTSIELRNNNIITITNGNSTLEMGVLCPPFCQ
jgi:hypothetical protein